MDVHTCIQCNTYVYNLYFINSNLQYSNLIYQPIISNLINLIMFKYFYGSVQLQALKPIGVASIQGNCVLIRAGSLHNNKEASLL